MSHAVEVLLASLMVSCTVSQASALSPGSSSAPADSRPRVIVTTDGEIDDRCSMIRFLLYTNEWEVLGLIHSSSVHHWRGDRNHKARGWQGTTWLDRQLDRYEQVHTTLRQHDRRYPSPEHLRKQVFVGNVAYASEMEAPTPGSQRIVEVLLDGDPRPVWLQAWGGANTIARALKTIQDEHADRMDEVSAKAIIYLIDFQDDTYPQYIAPHWPKLRVVANLGQFAVIGYGWRDAIPQSMRAYFEREWMRRNILRDHGPLCAMYESRRGRFISEGDSPAFMHLIDVGLDNAENPDFGGWGGRFARDGHNPSLWKDAPDDGDPCKPIWRWAAAFQNDWAARADRCVKPADQANHPPKVMLAHPARLQVHPGEAVTLDASSSQDPDGHQLSYSWWHYAGCGVCGGPVSIDGADRQNASMTVPPDIQPGQTIHVICEVTDAGDPPLTRYARVVLTCATAQP